MRKVVQSGLSGVVWADQGPVRYLEANLAMLRPFQVISNMTLSVSEPHFDLKISQSLNIIQKLFFIQNLRMDFSFQRKKMV